MASRRPNILFFFADQQRWDTVGAYGGLGSALGLTPNLDRLAAEGVRFEHAFTCQPVCGPARACLQTGKYATELGCFRNEIALPLDETTIAQRLSEAGYQTAYVGKWHLASTGKEADFRTRAVPPERRGGYKDGWVASDVLEFTSHAYDGHLFDAEGRQRDFPPGRYRADATVDFALEFLRERDARSPFFLFISPIEPHHQNDHNHFEGPTGSKERFADFPVPGDLEGLAGDWREEMPDYLGCCAALDANVGRLRAELERQGIAGDTLLIYTSDHGCHFRTRNSEYKRSCHDSSLRIPMLAAGPGFRGGKVVSELVSLLDLPPTVLTAAEVAVPDSMRGRPAQALLRGAADWPREIFAQISESQVGRCIRTERWKYSVVAPDKHGGRDAASDRYVEEFLYDLEADPHERTNRVADPAYADVRRELAARLKRRMVEAGEAEPAIERAPVS